MSRCLRLHVNKPMALHTLLALPVPHDAHVLQADTLPYYDSHDNGPAPTTSNSHDNGAAPTASDDTAQAVLPQSAYYHPNNHLFPSLSNPNPYISMHEHLPRTYGRGQNLMDRFMADRFHEERRLNLYYPFASKDEWELAYFLEQSGMSMQAIDKFLHINAVVRYEASVFTPT